MGLREIDYREDYRSGEANVLKDFFFPSFNHANQYWRAVGYFSSSALELFGKHLYDFAKRGGTIRLVTSVELNEADVKAIEEGLSSQIVCEQRIEEIMEQEFADGMGDGVALLGSLLKTNRLEIQIALPAHGRGIYHEKIGLFFDQDDYIAFSGSTNESRNAFEYNLECIDVFTSWDSQSRTERKKQYFERLWGNKASGAIVFSFPDAAKQKLIRISEQFSPRRKPQDTSNKWRHQEEAKRIFLQHERGILNMATGTGKTRTALNITQTLFENDQIDTVIVSTHGTDLLKQWYKQLLDLRGKVDRRLRVYRQYDGTREIQNFNLNQRNAILLVSRSSIRSALKGLGDAKSQRTLLIHDEVHGLGSMGNRENLGGLSDNIRYRLGLSATPERKYDSDGNAFVETHIGPVIFSFGLQEAIQRQILAPFQYIPLDYSLTDEDRNKLQRIHANKAYQEKIGAPVPEERVWMDIAKVYKLSQAKLPIFAEFITENVQMLERCIIFVEEMAYGGQILDIVHRHRTDFHTYFSGEDAETLRRFATGELECLITCHRLSEGIDIRSLNNVILLASNRANLETIQRIGRCLRTDPQNSDKVANVVDFIRNHENDNPQPNSDERRRDWLVELARVRPEMAL
ncbi:MAG: DEAD/DEAH box helicase family protein [Candidatus Promineifilaceae bacterium]